MGDFLAYELLPVILNMTLTASVVIVFVLLARLALRRAPRVCSYALWLVVLFRLLCPVMVSAPISLIPETVGSGALVSRWEGQYTEPVQQFIHSGTPEYRAAVDAGRQPLWGDGGSYVVTGPDGLSEPETNGSTRYPVLAPLWLTGAVAMMIWGAVSLVRLRRRLVGAVPLEKGVYLADHIDTPFVLGLFRPKIYLPSTLPEGERGYILLHERHHIRRLDHAVKLLAFLALCVHWFNPLVWLMFVLLGRDMEMSCDEAVMRKLGEAVRADYSASLLRLATGRKIIAGAPLAFGEGDTRDRVVNVLKWKRPRLWAVLAGAAACAAVIAACAVNPGGDGVEAPGEMSGTYASVEDYAMECMSAETATCYTAAGKTTARVTAAKIAWLDKEGEVEGLAPEGTLEAWGFNYLVQVDADDVQLAGGMYEENGWYDLEGQGGRNIVALRYPDGSYDILYDGPADADRTFYNGDYDSWEEALCDWYVTEYGLDLPLYVEDWINEITYPEGASRGNFPVHRFDGNSWYLYIPESSWERVLTEDPETQWQWVSSYGTGATLLVERMEASLADQQTALERQGFVSEDGAKRAWTYLGGNIRCWLYETGGGCLRVTTDYDSSRITDDSEIAVQPQVLTLMAESFTLDERMTAKPRLTLADVRTLAEKGGTLSWADFEGYEYIETGSGLYIRVYPIDGTFSLSIGGGLPEQGDPLYIHLESEEDFIDIRREDVDAFIRSQLPGGGADSTGE